MTKEKGLVMKGLLNIVLVASLVFTASISMAEGQISILSDPSISRMMNNIDRLAFLPYSLNDGVVVKAEFNIYPNPVMGESSKLMVEGLKIGSYKVILFDYKGRVHFNMNKEIVEANEIMDLEIYKKMEPGEYWLLIKGKDSKFKKKLVVI